MSASCDLGRQDGHTPYLPKTVHCGLGTGVPGIVQGRQLQATGSSGSQSCWWPSTAHLPAHAEALAPSLLPPAALQDVQRPLTSPHLQVSHSVMVV
jgi:hypothetical protein